MLLDSADLTVPPSRFVLPVTAKREHRHSQVISEQDTLSCASNELVAAASLYSQHERTM